MGFAWDHIFPMPAVRRLTQLAQRSFGVALNFVDHRGWLQGIQAGRFFNPTNRLLALVSANDEGFKAKRDAAFRLAAEVAALRLPKRQVTEMGTALAAVPLIVDGKYVGYVYADDFFEAESLTDQRIRFESFLRRRLPTDTELLKHVDEVPVLSPGDISYLLDLLDAIADEVAGGFAGTIVPTAGGTTKTPTFTVPGFNNPYIIGQSGTTRELVAMLARVAASDATVLITGESGTGKELVAKTLHENSKRRAKDFVAVNCGAFHEHLLESELFGHMKGAFTGATDTRMGFFERADGGSLFLDEIGETTLATQVKMLRFLQESTFIPVGSSKEKSSNVRVVAATNRDLRQELKKGRFREDLYYRLKVIQVTVAPLRERKDDIPLLVAHFIAKHGAADASATVVPGMAAKTMEHLVDYHWPGNIRQLENEVKRLCVLGRGDAELMPDLLSPDIVAAVRKRRELCHIDDRLKRTLEEREKKLIVEGLGRTAGNKSRLARDLGMSRTVLANKIKKYGIAG